MPDTEVREYRGPIVRKYGPNGVLRESRVVKNLGWLYRNAADVRRIRLVWRHTLPNGAYTRELVAVLLADGTRLNGCTFKYGAVFNSAEVAREYMSRRRFAHCVREDRTVPVLSNGPYANPALNDSRTIGERMRGVPVERVDALGHALIRPAPSGPYCPWPKVEDVGRIYPSPEFWRKQMEREYLARFKS